MESMRKNTDGYIHSFSQAEQDRLIRQSRSLEPYVHAHIDFARCRHVLEVGCGVGAQMEVLLSRWPHLKITGIDSAEAQIARARAYLKNYVETGRAALDIAEGGKLPFANNSFDGAFICWVLEHTPKPVALLKEVKRVIKPGGPLYCTEVFNSGLYIYPPAPAIDTYWEAFNRYQRELGGDPDVGIKLANLALEAGFTEAVLYHLAPQLDDRMKHATERAAFMDYWTELFLSAAPALLANKKIATDLVDEMRREMDSIKTNPGSVFIYWGIQLRAAR
ncbi:MAG TPA: class I SAM-dependent methyltransferase [Acidiferrobacterales bacterium]|nr:class I SAM-dependent methyltransferase [Acidiferrobacterales bacterium]